MYENEPKLNYITIVLVGLVVIIIVLVCILIFKKDDCDCSKYINNCDNQTNNTKPETSAVKEEITDYIKLGKDLYNKATDAYWTFNGEAFDLDNEDKIVEEETEYYFVKDYDQITNSLFTENGKKQLDEELGFVVKDNKRYSIIASRGQDLTYIGLESFVIKYNSENKITYNVTNKYCALEQLPEDVKTCTDEARITTEFVIVNDNNTWKVDSFKLAN